MPIIRVNAQDETWRFHGAELFADDILRQIGSGPGPVIIMIHGYSYQPGDPVHCPHRHILGLHPRERTWGAPSWPRGLGFDSGAPGEGLGIAFGWPARGTLWGARRRAIASGHVLASLIRDIHDLMPGRRVHVAAHSLGVEVAAEALHHLPPDSLDRIVSMTGACYGSRMREALRTPAGRGACLINITTRENDLFDFLFERLIAPPARADRALGHGLEAENAVTLQLDCPTVLRHLSRLGLPVAPAAHRITHWSAYLRPGVLRLYGKLMRQPEVYSLSRLRAGLPKRSTPRWSRLLASPIGDAAQDTAGATGPGNPSDPRVRASLGIGFAGRINHVFLQGQDLPPQEGEKQGGKGEGFDLDPGRF